MSNLPRLVYAGTPEFAVPALTALHDAGYPIVGVLTQPDRPAGRGRRLTASPVRRTAEALGLAVAQPRRLDAEALDVLRAWSPEAVIVAAYGLLFPSAALAVAPLGCINVHASLLPRWRGAAPIQRAVLAGDPVTGISIMRMVEALDAGPVHLKRQLDIGAEETAGELHDRLARLGAAALLEALPGIVGGQLPAQPQDEARVTHAAKLSKAEALLDWRRPADELARQVRAFNPWPVAETTLHGERVRIWRARGMSVPAAEPPGSIAVAGGRVEVATGDGTLELVQLQWPGGRVLDAREAAAGRSLHGRVFG